MKTKSGLKLKHKRIKFQQLGDSNSKTGEISILGASFLNIDRGNEIIVPGAYLPYLDRFSKNGKVLIDHGYSVRAIAAKAFRAYETKAGLVIDARFTGDETGQWTRDRAIEGAIDTTSIGHFVHGEPVIAKEAEVRQLWEKHEYTPSNYDMKMMTRGPVRLITDAEPVEVSFVVVPMNPEARILEVKSILEELETKKGSVLNRVNRSAVVGIYRLVKSILKSAKLEIDESQEAADQGGPKDKAASVFPAKSKSRTDLLKLKLKLLELDRQVKSL